MPRPGLPTGVAPTSDATIGYKSAAPGNGEVDSVTDGAGTESYIYDSLGRTTTKTRTIDTRSYQTQYQYNQANQLTLMIYPSGKRVRMNFDGRARLSGEDNVDTANSVLTSYVSSIGYNEAGQTTGLSLGNGVNETYGYSIDRLQLTSQTATVGTRPLIDLKYIYQMVAGDSGAGTTAANSGQLMLISGAIGPQSRTQRFKYDDLGRLATASGKGLWERSYSYDRWGNRTSVHNTISGQEIQNVALQPQQGAAAGVPSNRAATITNNGVQSTQTYDASGNLTADGVHNYQYDAESRVVSVDGGNTASSAYDSANRRVKKVAGGVTTHYVWEGSQVIAEYNGSTGALISEYVFAGSRMVAREQSGVLRYFLQDRFSTRLITDSSGNWVGREDHFPFGEDAGTGSGESEKHRFTSYERDSESNTDYAINRQYAMGSGRFMQPDAGAGSISNPQSFNRYAYVGSDPINSVDPYGLFAIIIGSPLIDLGPIGEITVTAEPDPIIPIGIGPFGPGEGFIGPIIVSIDPPAPPPTDDCHRFADIVDRMAKGRNLHLLRKDDLTAGVQKFMDALAARFTEFTGATYFDAGKAWLGITNEHFDVREFGSGGFAAPYFEADSVTPSGRHVPNNQVRHAVGGLLAGYVRGEAVGLRQMQEREDPNDPIHGVPDINLNNQTVPMGARIAGREGHIYAANLAQWIRDRLCAH